MSAHRWLERGVGAVAVAIPLGIVLLVLVAAGQPLFTDDLWWHLGLGRAYLDQGPSLAADPLLFTAAGSPTPAAWLSDVGLAVVSEHLGLQALRILHVALVVAIFWGVAGLARRAGASVWGAAAATAIFAAMTAYRLVQLRPHLVTILATLVLYRLLLERPERLGRLRAAAAVALIALWSNLHGAFLLGPALVLAAALAWWVHAVAVPGVAKGAAGRALGLGATALAGLVATGLGPGGLARHTAAFEAGRDTPDLSIVLDEWTGLDPFAWPPADLPPSVLTWLLFWGLAGASAWAAVRLLRDPSRRQEPAGATLVVLALLSLGAMVFAVRFAWLCVFPLLLVATAARAREGARAPRGRAVQGLARLTAALLLPAFVLFGGWPMVSRGIHREGFTRSYLPAYPTGKYYAGAVWFLADAGLSGNLFNEYFCGGFVGYWLAPELRAFANGSLNLPRDAMDAHRALREGRGLLPGETFLELLDRYEVDVFLGVGTPRMPRGARPVFYSTALLEGAPGWRTVFRNQHSAVYLRDDERNRENLERVASYYEEARVPFDPARGFEPRGAVASALPWATEHGVVPLDFGALQAAVRSNQPAVRAAAADRLATTFALLGLYEQSLRMDGRLRKVRPEDAGANRRVVWSLLRLGRAAAARDAAGALGDERLDRLLRATAESLAVDGDPEIRALVRRLPVMTHAESARALRTTLGAPVRPARTRS